MSLPPDHRFYTPSPKEPTMTQPALTKEQASDLKSHTDRLVETELQLHIAKTKRNQAENNLNSFVHSLQFPKAG